MITIIEKTTPTQPQPKRTERHSNTKHETQLSLAHLLPHLPSVCTTNFFWSQTPILLKLLCLLYIVSTVSSKLLVFTDDDAYIHFFSLLSLQLLLYRAFLWVLSEMIVVQVGMQLSRFNQWEYPSDDWKLGALASLVLDAWNERVVAQLNSLSSASIDTSLLLHFT